MRWGFSYARDEVKIAEGAALDGIYVVTYPVDASGISQLSRSTNRLCSNSRGARPNRGFSTKKTCSHVIVKPDNLIKLSAKELDRL